MIVSEFTKSTLKIRRDRRDMIASGWEFVSDSGGKLWELHRGYRRSHVISDVKIAACGKALWIKTQKT